MKEEFVYKKFSAQSLQTINQIISIIDIYEKQGYKLSVRQLYYQLVAKTLIENSEKSYKRIVNLVSDARLAGIIDWDMIEDRNRETISPPMWKDPSEIVLAASQQFAIDRWEDQENYVEVMVEKAALEGVLLPVCIKNGIRFTANRGYNSQSTMYEIGKRLEHKSADGKNIFILYLGDHDPSGIDMTRDVKARLLQFSREIIEIQRLALNFDQIEAWQPPENPAKASDSRFATYVDLYGESSWELDAVDPATLGGLVEVAIEKLRDDVLYKKALEREELMKSELKRFANNYSKQ